MVTRIGVNQDLEPSVVDLFDRNSGSTLEKVVMGLHLEEEKDAAVLLETLQRNKQTIQILHPLQAADVYSRDDEDGKTIQDQVHQLLNLPSLVDCRLVPSFVYLGSSVRLLLHQSKREETQNVNHSSNLKILWLQASHVSLLARNDSDLLRNLSSLVVDGRSLNTTDLKLVLKKSRHTLRHVEMKTDDHETNDDDEFLDVSEPQVSDVTLPNLQVLGLSSYSSDYPSWLKIPTTSTLVTRFDVMAHLPAISKLWIGNTSLKHVDRLKDRCPELVELRVKTVVRSPSTKACKDLISVLRQRKENCEAGLVAEGMRMVPLKTLTIDVGTLKSNILDQMKELVEEVVDIQEVSPVVEVEVEV